MVSVVVIISLSLVVPSNSMNAPTVTSSFSWSIAFILQVDEHPMFFLTCMLKFFQALLKGLPRDLPPFNHFQHVADSRFQCLDFRAHALHFSSSLKGVIFGTNNMVS